jgi:hypothetical protein
VGGLVGVVGVVVVGACVVVVVGSVVGGSVVGGSVVGGSVVGGAWVGSAVGRPLHRRLADVRDRTTVSLDPEHVTLALSPMPSDNELVAADATP